MEFPVDKPGILLYSSTEQTILEKETDKNEGYI